MELYVILILFVIDTNTFVWFQTLEKLWPEIEAQET